MKKLKCKVVMLATDNPIKVGDIIKRENSEIPIQIVDNPLDTDGRLAKLEWKVQHLHLVSDEEIQVGDTWLKPTGKIHISVCSTVAFNNPEWLNSDECVHVKKVVATTDSTLNLPLIPQGFIEEYVASNGKIEEVEIEVVEVDGKVIPVQEYSTNAIVILQPKKTWTRDEVEALIMKYSTEHYFHHCTEFLSDDENPEGYHANHVNKWIQDNLK